MNLDKRLLRGVLGHFTRLGFTLIEPNSEDVSLYKYEPGELAGTEVARWKQAVVTVLEIRSACKSRLLFLVNAKDAWYQRQRRHEGLA